MPKAEFLRLGFCYNVTLLRIKSGESKLKMQNIKSQVELLEHSKAKIDLYGYYLSIYLNILSRTKYARNIFIFDLLCGEGRYKNNAEGSPLIAVKKVKDHYFSNGQTCPSITIWFNDSEWSKIESNVLKVDRVKKFVMEMYVPENVVVEYFAEDYESIHKKAVKATRDSIGGKGLFFIDPYGYKGITPKHIKETVRGGKNELLLFLPISHMYRFAYAAVNSSFIGSEHLNKFLIELFGRHEVPNFSSSYDFIDRVKNKLREYFSIEGIFVDTFSIERDNSNTYCLFFFTSNIVGFEKMVEAKWKMDTANGRGFRYDRTLPLFRPTETSDYPELLRDFICTGDGKSNDEVRLFGLQHGFLPKHTNEILKDWIKSDNSLKVVALDGQPVRKSATYLSSKTRAMMYKFIDTHQTSFS